MIELILYLAIIGLIAWAVTKVVPMPAQVQTVIIIVAVLACILIALRAFNIHIPNPSVPSVR